MICRPETCEEAELTRLSESGVHCVMPYLDVRAAVNAAVKFLEDINPSKPPEDVAVEEVELSDDEKTWYITLGYYPSGSSVARFAGREYPRMYRVFNVNGQTGEVLSMKIREIAR